MQILCATDFSAPGDRATALAAALAGRLGAKLVLLHVVEPIAVALPYPVDTTGQIEVAIQNAADVAIATSVEGLRKQGHDVEGKVVFGTARASIAEVAREMGAQLLVVGSHGRTGVARMFLGSVAAWLAKSAPCPVLVCVAGARGIEKWQSGAPLRLALGIDATRASAAAVDWIAAASPVLAGDLRVVRLYWPFQEALRYGLDQAEPQDRSPSDLIKLVDRDLKREIPASLALGEDALRFREAHVNAAEVLAESAAAFGADAIVIGVAQHGLEKWNAVVPDALLRCAEIPVFCIPEALRIRKTTEISAYRSVLVATDLSPASNQALPKAYGLLGRAGGRVELCHVHERGQQGGPLLDLSLAQPLRGDERGTVEHQLQALIPPQAEAIGITTHVAVLEGVSAAQAILQAAKRLDVDVIVLASHGRSGIERALLGSVAEEVVRHADRPVLVVHEQPV